MDKGEEKALSDIEEYGCHVINVFEGEDQPQFSYSIGINKKQNKPDLIIVGLKRELAHPIINDYKNRLLQGESFEPNKFYKDFLEDFDVCFIKVDKSEFYVWAQPILNETGKLNEI